MAELAKVADIPEGSGLRVEADGKEIALFRVGDHVYAIDPVCKHMGGPLDQGDVEEGIVTCPWHGWEYNVVEGTCVNTGEKIDCFEVEVREGSVFLK